MTKEFKVIKSEHPRIIEIELGELQEDFDIVNIVHAVSGSTKDDILVIAECWND